MTDYDALVKRLRNRANGSYEEKCEGCEFTEDFPPCVHCTIKAFNEAADAIEELLQKEKFHAFLWNVINPNDMKLYLEMYHSGNEKEDAG